MTHEHRWQCGDGQREEGGGSQVEMGKGVGNGEVCNSVNTKNKVKKISGGYFCMTHEQTRELPWYFVQKSKHPNSPSLQRQSYTTERYYTPNVNHAAVKSTDYSVLNLKCINELLQIRVTLEIRICYCLFSLRNQQHSYENIGNYYFKAQWCLSDSVYNSVILRNADNYNNKWLQRKLPKENKEYLAIKI